MLVGLCADQWRPDWEEGEEGLHCEDRDFNVSWRSRDPFRAHFKAVPHPNIASRCQGHISSMLPHIINASQLL